MKCPLCGGNLSISRTDSKISDSLVQRDRSCDTPLCPFIEQTYEILEIDGIEALLDKLFDLVWRVALAGNKEATLKMLAAAHKEIYGKDMNEK